MTAEMILNYSPQNPALAALFLLLAYGLKSVTVVFPVSALQLAAGLLFEPWVAFGLNLCGLLITLSLPYWIGRRSGAGAVDKILQKWPRLRQIAEKQQNTPVFLSYFLRVIGCLPGDLVSLYLGACRIPYPKYLLGGMLGSGLHLLAYTMLGTSISDPTSPEFLTSVAMTFGVSAFSLIVKRICSRDKPNYSQNGK